LLGVELSDCAKVCLALCDDTVRAVRDQCTHQAFPLSEGDLLPNGRITCAWHGAEFDCATGRACRGPAAEDVETFQVMVSGTDIYVRVK
jgi:3-phenylpropionate/trans-cinnamate dioxygenase ferredoxin component